MAHQLIMVILLLSPCFCTDCFDPDNFMELIETFELETLLGSIIQLENQIELAAAQEETVNRANDCLVAVQVILRDLPNDPSGIEILLVIPAY